MQYSVIEIRKVWQKQDCKHQIFQHLHLLQLSLILHNMCNNLHNLHNKDNNYYILIGHILNQNFQESQKMLKLIYLVLMIGWMYITF